MVSKNIYSSNIKDHQNKYDSNEKFELLEELWKCDMKTWNEKSLLEKWYQ